MKTNHRMVRKNRKKVLMIGIVKKIFATILLTILVGSHALAPTANAGFLDWLIDRTNDVQPSLEYQSISHIFTRNMAFIPDKSEMAKSSIVGNAILAYSVIDRTPGSITVRQRLYLEVSAYNSEVSQTDDSPFITASNTHVRDGIVATNILPFGTRVKIPNYFGDKIFVVEDRMNRRYQNNMDIWMEQKSDALSFGRRSTIVEVIW